MHCLHYSVLTYLSIIGRIVRVLRRLGVLALFGWVAGAFCIKSHQRNSPPTTQHDNNQHKLPDTQWATFTYIGKETLYITNVFKYTGLKIAFRTNNILENLLTQRDRIPDKFSSSGVYKLTCPDCQKSYVGQNVRQFNTRYKEHRSAFYHNSRTSNFAQHL